MRKNIERELLHAEGVALIANSAASTPDIDHLAALADTGSALNFRIQRILLGSSNATLPGITGRTREHTPMTVNEAPRSEAVCMEIIRQPNVAGEGARARQPRTTGTSAPIKWSTDVATVNRTRGRGIVNTYQPRYRRLWLWGWSKSPQRQWHDCHRLVLVRATLTLTYAMPPALSTRTSPSAALRRTTCVLKRLYPTATISSVPYTYD